MNDEDGNQGNQEPRPGTLRPRAEELRQHMRYACLELAHHDADDPGKVVKRAEAYIRFIENGANDGEET